MNIEETEALIRLIDNSDHKELFITLICKFYKDDKMARFYNKNKILKNG